MCRSVMFINCFEIWRMVIKRIDGTQNILTLETYSVIGTFERCWAKTTQKVHSIKPKLHRHKSRRVSALSTLPTVQFSRPGIFVQPCKSRSPMLLNYLGHNDYFARVQ